MDILAIRHFGLLAATASVLAACVAGGTDTPGSANPITGDAIEATALDGAPIEGAPLEDGTESADAAAATDAPGDPDAASDPAAPILAPTRTSRSTRLVDRDVEAPEVFQTSDTALWDGRPSLGGVWVASPDATDPERVILRNPSNGQFVIGALFRRERDNPGPKLQISSDAAEALGALAGQPVEISVTALRREEAPEAAPSVAAPVLDTAETLDPSVGADDIAAGAAAALDRTAATTPPPEQPPAEAPPAPTPAAGGDIRIQVGIFSVEANANRAASTLSSAGIAATIRKESSQGKDFWSVIASGSGNRNALLEKVRGAGFADAYVLSR
ncbi:MAG: SPOR domain-containing protein [Paracoccaceae bacterium]